jgi:hypothetical protein
MNPSRVTLTVAGAGILLVTWASVALGGQHSRIWLTCAGVDSYASSAANPYVFHPSALRSPRGAENRAGPAAAALRDALATGKTLPGPSPKHSYVLLRRTPDHALYGHLGGRAGVDGTISVAVHDGVWQFEGNTAGCVLTRIFFGNTTAAFSLERTPSPTTRVLLLAVSAGTCGAPRDAPRHAHVLIGWQREKLAITVLMGVSTTPRASPAKPPPCAGVETTFGLRVVLPRPVGKRVAVDGAYYPPRPAARTRGRMPPSPVRTIVVR